MSIFFIQATSESSFEFFSKKYSSKNILGSIKNEIIHVPKENPAVMIQLLSSKFNEQDTYGNSYLHIAIYEGNQIAVEILVELVDLSIENHRGKTALELAHQSKDSYIIELIEENLIDSYNGSTESDDENEISIGKTVLKLQKAIAQSKKKPKSKLTLDLESESESDSESDFKSLKNLRKPLYAIFSSSDSDTDPDSNIHFEYSFDLKQTSCWEKYIIHPVVNRFCTII